MSSHIQKSGASSSTSNSTTTNSSSNSNDGKQRRRARSSCPRKVNLVNIDVAEARRQVYHALLLHRKSSFPFSSSSSSTSSSRNVALNVATNYSTQLPQSMPQADPVWSTTGPTVVLPHVTNMPCYGEAMDVEFVWGDQNQAASYAWWLAFLKNLDGNKASVDEEFKCPLALGSSSWFGNVKVEEVDDHKVIDSSDEWLMIPSTEDNYEGTELRGAEGCCSPQVSEDPLYI